LIPKLFHVVLLIVGYQRSGLLIMNCELIVPWGRRRWPMARSRETKYRT